MWNIPLLKLQSESKPRTFRTHRGHWGMLEYSMDTCHLKKRERRNLNSRIGNLPLKHRSHPPYSCFACVKPFEVLFKNIYWAPSTRLHAGTSRWTLTPLTTRSRAVWRDHATDPKPHRKFLSTCHSSKIDLPFPHRYFMSPSLLCSSLFSSKDKYFTSLSCLFSACLTMVQPPHRPGCYLFCSSLYSQCL